MKRTSVKNVLTILLAVLMLASCAVGLMVTVSAAEVSVQNGSGNRGAVRVGDTFAYRAKVNGEFTAFAYSMPTWTETNSACTLALYKWTGTLNDSLSKEPIASQRFDPMRDNATNKVTFDPQPAGEYLFVVQDTRGAAGVWTNEGASNTLGFLYIDGMEKPDEPDLKITFTEKLDEPFGKCEPMEDPVDGNHTPPAEYVIPDDSLIKTHEVMPDTWVFTDGLGRVSLTNAEVGDLREDKTVAMFYWTWHAEQGGFKPFNNQEFLDKYPEAINDYDHPGWPISGYQHAWNESIYGFYRTTDTWVIRRQGEMLANAGVDAIFTDNTNGTFTWRSSYQAVFQTWSDAMDDGVLTPKVSFMTPFAANADTVTQLRNMYMDFYRKGDYQKLWFYWEGKPMLMSHGGDAGLLNTKDNTEKEIKNFFTWRPNYAGYINGTPGFGQWGWLSTYPQAVYYATNRDKRDGIAEQVTVGVAVNHNYELGMISAMNGGKVIGRSYTSQYQDRYEKEGTEASKWGYNFSEQFDYALEVDPKVVFITGWNEWIAGRYKSWPEGYKSAVENAFPDQCNDEYSRDLEPTKGALQDHYYYLMVNYVRKYKGARPIPAPSLQATIDITKDNTQWSAVEPYYAAYIGNTDDREANGYNDIWYWDYSGRNDIIGARVARDEEFVYFYVECFDNITPYTDPLWMVLYIDSDQQNQGWETFDYVLNKTSPSATKATLEKFTGNGYETQKVGEVDYAVDGKYMQVKVPKSMLNLSGYDFTVNFAWTDNVHDEDDQGEMGDTGYKYTKFSGDIMNFYISGDVAPAGRFKFSYISTNENATGIPDETQPAETEPVTVPDEDPAAPESNSPVTEAPTAEGETETDAPTQGGCASAVAALSMTAMIMLLGSAVILRKRED